MGSSFGIMYGLPKVHKSRPVPLRPILAAYNQGVHQPGKLRKNEPTQGNQEK